MKNTVTRTDLIEFTKPKVGLISYKTILELVPSDPCKTSLDHWTIFIRIWNAGFFSFSNPDTKNIQALSGDCIL
jgi:hypothetical protein